MQHGNGFAEFLPVLGRIKVEERVGKGVVERPAQGQLAGLAGDQAGDDGAVAGYGDVHAHVGRVFYPDGFTAMLRRLKSCGSLVQTVCAEGFDVEVLHGRFNVGEPPGDPTIVADDDEGHPRERDAGNVEVVAVEVGRVPEVGHLVREVHIVREQWLARIRVGAGDDPIVGAGL